MRLRVSWSRCSRSLAKSGLEVDRTQGGDALNEDSDVDRPTSPPIVSVDPEPLENAIAEQSPNPPVPPASPPDPPLRTGDYCIGFGMGLPVVDHPLTNAADLRR